MRQSDREREREREREMMVSTLKFPTWRAPVDVVKLNIFYHFVAAPLALLQERFEW